MSKSLCCLLFAACAAVAQQATVPLIVEGNAPIVELSFRKPSGEVRKARFLVDTGGGAFILGSKLVADVGVERIGEPVKSEGDRFQKIGPFSVKLGDMELDLSGVNTFGLADHAGIGSRDDAEGLIPAKLLRKYDVVFDYPGRKFTLAKSSSIDPRGIKVASPIANGSGFPRLELEIGGKTYGFLLDSGASFTMISRTVLEEWSKANAAWPSALGATGFANMFGGPMEKGALMLRIPQAALGTITVKDLAAVSRPDGTFEKSMSRMMSAPIVGALAGNLWRDFRVQIDYKNGFTYLERSGSTPDFDQTSVGLVLTAHDGSLIVAGVSSQASDDVKSGVREGDRLVAVDEVPVSGKPLTAAAGALSGKAASHKRLTLERAGAAVTVTVTVATLL
jgi:predicted aspartyl protease